MLCVVSAAQIFSTLHILLLNTSVQRSKLSKLLSVVCGGKKKKIYNMSIFHYIKRK